MNTSLGSMLLAVGTTLATLATPAAAQPERPAFANLDDAAVESAFWQCDLRSMQTVLEPGEGMLCERLTDALKRRRFDGDFARFLDWWRERKAVEHARLGAAPGVESTGAADARAAQ